MDRHRLIILAVAGFLIVLFVGIGMYFKYKKPVSGPVALHEQSLAPAGSVPDEVEVNSEPGEEEEEIDYATISFSIQTDSVTRVNDSVQIVHKRVHLPEDAPCTYECHWDEVRLKNKALEQKVNAATWEFVDYKPGTDNKQMLTEYCESRAENEFSVTVQYADKGLLSIFATRYFYGFGAAHGARGFSTYNYSLQSGRKLNFHDLLKPQQISVMDTLTIKRLYKDYEMLGGYYSTDHFINQLSDLEFTIGEEGLTIFFRGPNYVTSILDLTWSYKELQPYVKPDGLLQPFYK